MNFTEEAQKLYYDLNVHELLEDHVHVYEKGDQDVSTIAAALAAVYERGEQSGREKERERCATIVEFFPNIADGPADADERVKWAVKHIVNGIRSQP